MPEPICVDCQRPLRPGIEHPVPLVDEHGSDHLCPLCAQQLVALASTGRVQLAIVIGARIPAVT